MSENPLITFVTIAVTAALIVLFEKRKRARQAAAEHAQRHSLADATGAAPSRQRSFPTVPRRDQTR